MYLHIVALPLQVIFNNGIATFVVQVNHFFIYLKYYHYIKNLYLLWMGMMYRWQMGNAVGRTFLYSNIVYNNILYVYFIIYSIITTYNTIPV